MGPFIGPIFGGYIVHGTSNWYWIFGHLAIVLGEQVTCIEDGHALQ